MPRTNAPTLTRRLTPPPAAVLLVVLAGAACVWVWSEVPAAARHVGPTVDVAVPVEPAARPVVAPKLGSRVAGNAANAE